MQKFAAVNGFDRRTRFNSPAQPPPAPIFSSRTITGSPEGSSRASHLSPGLNEYHTSRGTQIRQGWGTSSSFAYRAATVRERSARRRPPLMPLGDLFVGVGQRQDRRLTPVRAADLQ